MTKNKLLLFFFAFVFGFCAFADSVSECENYKSEALQYISMSEGNVDSIAYISSDVLALSSDLNANGAAMSILSVTAPLNSNLDSIRVAVRSIDCSSSNGTCSVDLGPVVEICSNIYAVVSSQYSFLVAVSNDLSYLASVFSYGNENTVIGDLSTPPPSYIRVWDESNLHSLDFLTCVVSNSFNSYTATVYDFFVSITNNLSLISSSLSDMFPYLEAFSYYFDRIMFYSENMNDNIISINNSLIQYLPYLETINSSIAYLATNEYFNVNVSNLSNYLVASSSSAFRSAGYYNKPSHGDPAFGGLTAPYTSAPLFNRAVFADSVRGGFMNLISSLSSVNNYLYWMYERFPTNNNNLAEISAGLASISNTLSRVDSYVLGDFSNQFYNVYSLLDTFVSNQLNSAAGLSALIETNNIYTSSNTFHLASIDSKLDVLDYIKILSDTPLSAYSGDGDYFDYLTNLYINGSSSAPPSTNWFERIEILLASLVFGDSDGTNDIPQSVEMEGVDSSAVESALSDYTYNQEFTVAINALDDTSQSFIGVLNGLHTSIKSVSLPASISIGLGGLDGEDTHNFEDMMHGHFQVSFNTGIADRFTIAVRAVTTISWILLFFLALWKSGFYLIRKLVYFYRLVTRLLVSVFTR